MLHSPLFAGLHQQVVHHHTAEGVGKYGDGAVEVRVAFHELPVLLVDRETQAVHYLREGERGEREGKRREGDRERKKRE